MIQEGKKVGSKANKKEVNYIVTTKVGIWAVVVVL